MFKLLGFALVGATSSFITSVYHGAGIAETLIVGIVASNAALIVWAAGPYVADRAYRRFVDADTMQRGICPECRTFNSLKEVTSADPKHRRVDCLACKESYRVEMTNNGVAAERLGKLDD